jgi:hypothetical protein
MKEGVHGFSQQFPPLIQELIEVFNGPQFPVLGNEVRLPDLTRCLVWQVLPGRDISNLDILFAA